MLELTSRAIHKHIMYVLFDFTFLKYYSEYCVPLSGIRLHTICFKHLNPRNKSSEFNLFTSKLFIQFFLLYGCYYSNVNNVKIILRIISTDKI